MKVRQESTAPPKQWVGYKVIIEVETEEDEKTLNRLLRYVAYMQRAGEKAMAHQILAALVNPANR